MPPPPEVRLIDLALAELDVPREPGEARLGYLDEGVVPWALVEYLRRCESGFPTWPEVEYWDARFRYLSGGIHLWAAGVVGWSPPLRCVLRAVRKNLPVAVWERTYGLKEAGIPPVGAPALTTNVLCFDRSLTVEEQRRVERDLAAFAIDIESRGWLRFTKPSDLHWGAANVMSWRSIAVENTEDRSALPEFADLLHRFTATGIPVAAWNGRTPPTGPAANG